MATTPDLDVHLLPDEVRWGPGYGPGRDYPADTLAEFAQYVRETQQPGCQSRLHANSPEYAPASSDGPARVPAGYDATGHPNRGRRAADVLDPEVSTSLDAL